jgi:phosphoadenosine phosphosulfate reductase
MEATLDIAVDIEALNKKYQELTPNERMHELFNDFEEDEILLTSSFGTSSVYLLYLFSRVRPNHKVYFLNTTYHFDETIAYREQLRSLYNLNIVDLLPNKWENEFTRKEEVWRDNPDLCCEINKVNVLDAVKRNHSVWITGLRKDQSDTRADKKIFEHDGTILKFYPIIDVDHDMVRAFSIANHLPEHPMVKFGYDSVGCRHCTQPGKGREGRWVGKEKTECGLHNRPLVK